VSLFPFLSILACVIGTLTLLITALALGQMDNDAVASAEEFERKQQQLEADLAKLERIRKLIANAVTGADDVQRQLANAQKRLSQVEHKVRQAIERYKAPQEPVDLPEVDTVAHKKRLESLQAELNRVEAERKRLLAELAKRD